MKKKSVEKQIKRPVKSIIFGSSASAKGIWCRLLQLADNESLADADTYLIGDKMGESIPPEFDIELLGLKGTEAMHIDCVAGLIDGYNNFDVLSALADNSEITTLFFSPAAEDWYLPNGKMKNDKFNMLALLTMLLFRRFCLEMRGYIIVPTAQKESNGVALKQLIAEYASVRGLGMDFINWLGFENTFVNTVVQSFPAGENKIEKYLLCIVDRPLPIFKGLLNVAVEKDITQYEKAVRYVQDGALSVTCAYSLLHEVETLSGFMSREKLVRHMTVAVFEEIIPTVNGSFEVMQSYTMDMLKRFENTLLNISFVKYSAGLTQSFKNSVVPIILRYIKINDAHPKHLVFGLFCTIQLMKMNDSSLETISLLKNTELWGCDLSFLFADINAYEERLK